ncbi:hypothetical protein ISP15_15215 [Dyella jejuensis]|uniref:Tetratricopeptide repeat protein n=1 Tax=Dyella jejuensis TaxID=1432009 RepID=A0ABW8JPB3_9GAMM
MPTIPRSSYWLLAAALLLTAIVYWPGLSGSWLFDDYPNIVDNPGVQPQHINLGSLVSAALSSPASDFKRPLASLSFALNFLITGLDPFWMKLSNLVIHLLNGLLFFMLSRQLLAVATPASDQRRNEWVALLIAGGWLVLPINLTAVLYTVQRMESMANLFVLLGLIGYLAGRIRIFGVDSPTSQFGGGQHGGYRLCVLSLTVPTILGLLAKETAVMLPLYACLCEWILFGFRKKRNAAWASHKQPEYDTRILILFVVTLILPAIIGLAALLPSILAPATWAVRNFNLQTRMLTEARVVVGYIAWIVLPTPHALSFYHDDFNVSAGLLNPWSTLVSLLTLLALAVTVPAFRRSRPLVTLGIALFLGSHLLTGTILPLELVYEHRNYFASYGVLLAIIPPLVPDSSTQTGATPRILWVRYSILVCLLLLWSTETALTARAWGDPLKLAEVLAWRAPYSPRAEYELGRTYIIYSHYDPLSPFTQMAYAPLERAAALPGSSILPEQALIFMNARMSLPLKNAWWNSMIDTLRRREPTVQDESSLSALTQCARDGDCVLPKQRMVDAYEAALSHPRPSARLLSSYGDYAWNVLQDHHLGLRMINGAIAAAPSEPAYRITQVRMLAASGQTEKARLALNQLKALNIGGRLDNTLVGLENLPGIN